MSKGQFYVVGNWKSNKTISEAVDWWKEFSTLWKKVPIQDHTLKIILCPSFIHLSTLASLIELSRLPVQLGVQDVSAFGLGAYTGQVCAEMVKDLVQFSLVGHSERRKYCHEEDIELFNKSENAHTVGIQSIYCVQQAEVNIAPKSRIAAYEPVAAIGTGNPETPEKANDVIAALKSSHSFLEAVLYGGSVTDKNVADYKRQPAIDGVLPGGASLEAKSFYSLLHNAIHS